MGIRPPTRPGRSGGNSVSRLRRISSRRSASARFLTSSPQPATGGNGNIGIGPDNLFIHMTGMSDKGWQAVKDVGAQVSIAFPIEMNMRHGMPPILKMQSLGMEPSLSVDVECTMTADFFTQMRVAMNMQRVVVNQMILNQSGNSLDLEQTNNWGLPPAAAANPWPTPVPAQPPLLTTRDVLRYATMNGAKALRLDSKVGSLTQGKEADIIILDATSDQRGAAQPGARRGRLADGPHQRRDGDCRGQGAQVERAAARCQSRQAAQPARGLARLYFPRRLVFRRTCSAASKGRRYQEERGRHQAPPFCLWRQLMPQSATFAAFLKTDL